MQGAESLERYADTWLWCSSCMQADARSVPEPVQLMQSSQFFQGANAAGGDVGTAGSESNAEAAIRDAANLWYRWCRHKQGPRTELIAPYRANAVSSPTSTYRMSTVEGLGFVRFLFEAFTDAAEAEQTGTDNRGLSAATPHVVVSTRGLAVVPPQTFVRLVPSPRLANDLAHLLSIHSRHGLALHADPSP